jgi:hypothetical protein
MKMLQARALPIDFEQQQLAVDERLLHRVRSGAVAIVENLRVLEKLSPGRHLGEAFHGDEVVVAPRDLIGPRLARRVGH